MKNYIAGYDNEKFISKNEVFVDNNKKKIYQDIEK